MKAKFALILILVIALAIFGAVMFAQETDTATTDTATTPEETVTTETTTAEPITAVGEGFVKARLVNVNNANNFTLIINGEEVVVALMGLDFSEADFYIFDKKHNDFVRWLLVDYQYIWVNYDPNRTTAKGTPLVYFYYGPWETELWEQSPRPLIKGDADAQSNRVVPNNVKFNFWGEPLKPEVYDHNVAEPFINSPEFSSVFKNWDPNYNPRKHGKVHIETDKSEYTGRTIKRKWYLKDLNRLILQFGFADVDTKMSFDRKAEFKNLVARAKWCRRGMWLILQRPNPKAEETCGITPKN